MKTVNELLDQVKAKNAITSDYKLAFYLGVAPGSVKNWRHERSLPDSKTVTTIANDLGMDADVLLLEIESQRAGNDFAKAAWMRIAHRLQAGVVHAAVLMCLAIVSIAGYAPNAEAAALSFDKSASGSVYYVNLLTRFFRALRRRALATVTRFVQGINHVQSADTDATHPHAA